MPAAAIQEWVSAYIHYSGDANGLLVSGIARLVDALHESSLATRVFFVRYFENGPHIRLRCECSIPDADEVRKLVQAWANGCPGDGGAVITRLEFVDYVPEVVRYGGPMAMTVAEDQFHFSTAFVLGTMGSSQPWTYSSAMGIALQSHLALFHAFGMDFRQIHDFCAGLQHQWMHSVSPTADGAIDAFEHGQARAGASIERVLSLRWDEFERRRGSDSHLDAWLDGMRTIASQLQSIVAAGLLEPADDPRASVFRILSSYVHMTNNRLGVYNRDEAYLAYLLKAWARSVASSDPAEEAREKDQ